MKYVCFYERKRKNVRWGDIIGFMTKHGQKSTKTHVKMCIDTHISSMKYMLKVEYQITENYMEKKIIDIN